MHGKSHKHTGSKFRLQQKTQGIHLNKVQSLVFVAGSAVMSIAVVLLTAKSFI